MHKSKKRRKSERPSPPPTLAKVAVKSATDNGIVSRLAAYRLAPNGRAYDELLESCSHQRGDEMAFAEAVLDVLAAHGGTPWALRQATIALWMAGRHLEAAHHAREWRALEPDSFQAAKFIALIALDRGDMPTAIAAHEQCVRLDRDSIDVARIWLLLHVAVGQLPEARSGAHEFLASYKVATDDMALIAEIGVRTNDASLVRHAVGHPARATFGPRREQEVLAISRIDLIDTLRLRVRE